jgi:hypothetical protein
MWGVALTTHLLVVLRLGGVEVYLYLPSVPAGHVTGQPLPILLIHGLEDKQ